MDGKLVQITRKFGDDTVAALTAPRQVRRTKTKFQWLVELGTEELNAMKALAFDRIFREMDNWPCSAHSDTIWQAYADLSTRDKEWLTTKEEDEPIQTD